MSLNDPMANALSTINNAEKVGQGTCTIKPISSLIKNVLDILRDGRYVGEYKEVKTGRGNYLILNLLGTINKCGAIKPRFSVTMEEYERFEKSFLPAKGFGMLIVSTSQGLLTHTEAKKKGIGGKLLAYCY